MPRKYASYECQRCGACIGWLGRFFDFFFRLLGINVLHDCKPQRTGAKP